MFLQHWLSDITAWPAFCRMWNNADPSITNAYRLMPMRQSERLKLIFL